MNALTCLMARLPGAVLGAMILLLTHLPPLEAQGDPDPAEQRAREILDLVNLGDPDSTMAYIRENFAPSFRDAFPMEQHTGMFARIREDMGRMVVDRVQVTSPQSVELLARSEDGTRSLKIVVQVEPAEPFRIASLGFAPGGGTNGRGGTAPGKAGDLR